LYQANKRIKGVVHMSVISRHRWRMSIGMILTFSALVLTLVFTLSSRILTFAAMPIVQISSDPYTNSTSQHQTEVEPDTFSFGSTIVSAFQVGRFTDGGASNIGWATSTNNGSTFTNGFLPGITKIVNPANPYDRVSDPSVAFDAAHNTWLIASLALTGTAGAAVLVNRSTDGGLTWGNPVVVHAASGSENLDKDWIVCDDTSTSFKGHCYVEWDDNGAGNLIHMSTSSDGGQSWGAQRNTANNATGIGGQPLVQPTSGTVIVPIDNANETAVLAFTSSNGGSSWSSTVTVATIASRTDPGKIRSGPLPSAEIDGAGKVYVVWEDCRFERNCKINDIVMSTSTNGTTWSAVTRIPSDPVGSSVDHFIPGLAVDKSTSGSTAHLVVAFYYYPNVSCSSSSCQLNVGYSSSTNGGTSWTATSNITGPMTLSWLASTTQGRMVGDYISTSFNAANPDTAFPVFANASAPTGSTFHEAMFTVAGGLAIRAGHLSSQGDPVVVSAQAGASRLPLTAR
jgi:BNR repeat-like domain